MNVEEGLEIVEKALNYNCLNKLQEIVFRQSWVGKSYPEIAAEFSYEPEYVKQIGFELWRLLSNTFGEKVTKNNFRSVLKRYDRQTQVPGAVRVTSLSTADGGANNRDARTAAPLTTRSHQDWDEAIDISAFFGRTKELIELDQWIVRDHCRLVVLLGMGGIGKTALAAKLAAQIQGEFEHLVWRSLRNAPPLRDLLAELIQFFSSGQETHLPENVGGISRLMAYLRSSRCLLLLDNVETILCEGDAGAYREGYEDYGQLLRCLAETPHQSCMVLTSREKPQGLAAKEGETLPVRSLQLTGLPPAVGQEILRAKGEFNASESEWREFVKHYAGNSLALKMIAPVIQEFFDGK